MTISRNLITPKKQWQPWEIELVTELYPHVECIVIAWFCNCSIGAVYQRAAVLGLKKDAATVAQVARERMTPDHPDRLPFFSDVPSFAEPGEKMVANNQPRIVHKIK